MALNNVLLWYQKRRKLEENRLALCLQTAREAKASIERHNQEVLDHRMDLIRSPEIEAQQLVALASFRDHARRREAQLQSFLRQCEDALELQRQALQAAQLRLRLVEKLHDRRSEELRYQAQRELEELASESFLASFAREL